MALAGLYYGDLRTHEMTVSTTATRIRAASAGAYNRVGLIMRNVGGGADIYVGPVGVTTAAGYPIPDGEELYIAGTLEMYAIVASGTIALRVIELL